MSNEKSWQKEPLRFPKKAIIVMDDRGGRAARCARKIIETFSCQSARATNVREFIQILQKATREGCEIVGIISDDGMPVKGSEILDGFARGHYAPYYKQPTDPDASTTACLLITGDHNLNYSGEAGVEKTLVFGVEAWNRFLKDPAGSAVGVLVASWLGIESPNASANIIRQERAETRAAGARGAADLMEGRRNDHDSEKWYLLRAKLGKAASCLKL